jgi:uncharacterized protein YgiM (DUF1202 family)
MCLLVSAVTALAETSPSVRVVTPKAQVLARPASGADLVMTAAQGTVLDVIDNDGGWYWVSLPPDRSGTRRRGWIQGRDVETVPPDLSAEVRELTEKVQQLQQQLNTKQSATGTDERSATYPIAPIHRWLSRSPESCTARRKIDRVARITAQAANAQGRPGPSSSVTTCSLPSRLT